MTRHCGREQMCDPCDQLPLSSDQSTVCISVGQVSSNFDIVKTSIVVLKDELEEELRFWVDDDDYVSKHMSEAALAALIELEPVARVPYSGPQHTEAELEV
jgi:hypothetical protein